MSTIEVYSTQNCPYCVRAKALLQSKGLEYEEIDISTDVERTREMIKRSGRRTVPQIFINDQSVGGFDQLAELNAAGKLDI